MEVAMAERKGGDKKPRGSQDVGTKGEGNI